MDELHLWVGIFSGTEEEFHQLFDLTSFYNSQEGEDFERCGFCKYLNKNSYDNDFIGHVYIENDLQKLLDGLPSDQLTKDVLKYCKNNKLTNPNAMLYYGDEWLDGDSLAKEFEGLKYIGTFDWE
ncbi:MULTISPECIES: immunity 22 family protein [Algibacter]|uniref:Immunity protein 22 of polymorphic toxin system n=1 Tax=Algibacter lectus TaxID=221126 RepID=A0A4R8MIM2_9FLAO|nr:immunity 22 family protein [Algibacter lectus]MWW26919.1 hypothetical protein [Algibacter lectus]TDY64202.1 immunity protein 22 of polymorphic toxin system [Algibacter lectus]TDY64205.1 immunity protein 22 of polymorphic toxin system [Algibacter lectus]SFB98627.1 Immunity protein 22 [Algibacter lectus]GAL65151.1 hypothetical protein JCM19300_2835 [Algibacter lectus]